MADRRSNLRAALEAEGADPETIADTLAEMDAEDAARDPHGRARSAGIPPLYFDASFDGIEKDEPGRTAGIRTAEAWARGVLPAKGLYLWSEGDTDEDLTGFGSGKTLIAAAAARAVLGAGELRLRWLDVIRLMTDLNLGYSNPRYEKAAEKVGPPQGGEAIVLDDIDKVPATERNIQPIFALVHDCVNGRTPLLITANRHPDDLQDDWGQRFGHAAASRIVGHCIDVEVRGRDRRLDGETSSA